MRCQPVALPRPPDYEQSATKEQKASERDSSSDTRIGPVEPTSDLHHWAGRHGCDSDAPGLPVRCRDRLRLGSGRKCELCRRPNGRRRRGSGRECELCRRRHGRLRRGSGRGRELARARGRLERRSRRGRKLPRRRRGHRYDRCSRGRVDEPRIDRCRRRWRDDSGDDKPEHNRSSQSEWCVAAHRCSSRALPTAGAVSYGSHGNLLEGTGRPPGGASGDLPRLEGAATDLGRRARAALPRRSRGLA